MTGMLKPPAFFNIEPIINPNDLVLGASSSPCCTITTTLDATGTIAWSSEVAGSAATGPRNGRRNTCHKDDHPGERSCNQGAKL